MTEHRRRRREEEEARRREIERRRRIIRERKRRQRIMRQRMILAGIGALVLVVGGVAIGTSVHKKNEEKQAKKIEEQKKKEAKTAEENVLHMVAVGDNLIHDAVINSGKEQDWSFDFLYENIKEDIEKADLASVNQETPFIKDHNKAAGYPDFATPTEVGDALAKAGFDIVTQATEHAFDRESDGITDSVEFWEKSYPKVANLGIHDKADEARYQVIKKKNFKIAVMNYSSLVSENHSIPEDESYMVDTYSEKNIKEDLAKAKEEADVSIVYLHGGKSDTEDSDEKLQEKIDFLAEQGADVVICSHPHILKKYGKVTRPDGKEMLVYHSLGNFVSHQSSLENLLGGMADFTLKKDAKSGEVTIEDYSLVPLVIHYNDDFTEAGVYKLSDYTDALAEEHKIHTEDEEAEFTVAALKEAAEKVATPVTDSTEKTSGEEVDAKKGEAEKDTKEDSNKSEKTEGQTVNSDSKSDDKKDSKDSQTDKETSKKTNKDQ
ncbi:MAG: CapA family protein [Bacillota bacterium]|nr:CapA family protein [Bacillota bacterium]